MDTRCFNQELALAMCKLAQRGAVHLGWEHLPS